MLMHTQKKILEIKNWFVNFFFQKYREQIQGISSSLANIYEENFCKNV